MSDDEGPGYVGVPEAARRLRVDPETVRRWIRSGRLPASRLPGGGRYRIAVGDLQLVLEPSRGSSGPRS